MCNCEILMTAINIAICVLYRYIECLEIFYLTLGSFQFLITAY